MDGLPTQKHCFHLFSIWLEFLLKMEVSASKKPLNVYLSESTYPFLPAVSCSFNLPQAGCLPTSTARILKKELSLKLSSPQRLLNVRDCKRWFTEVFSTTLQNRQRELLVYHHPADGLGKGPATHRISTESFSLSLCKQLPFNSQQLSRCSGYMLILRSFVYFLILVGH